MELTFSDFFLKKITLFRLHALNSKHRSYVHTFCEKAITQKEQSSYFRKQKMGLHDTQLQTETACDFIPFDTWQISYCACASDINIWF